MNLPKLEHCVEIEPSHIQSPRRRARAKQKNIRILLFGALPVISILIVVIACALWQGDGRTVRYAAAAVALALLITSSAFLRGMHYVGGWIAFSVLAAWSWLYWGGSYNHRFDYLALALCFMGAALNFRETRHWLKEHRFRRPHPLRGTLGLRFALTFLLGFWVVASMLDIAVTSNPTLRRDPTRFQTLRSDWRYRDLKVGMALSGGGYRAALVHAGALDAFERLHVPVTHLTSVSGGSIIGAFYAAGGTPAEFRRGVAEGRFNLTREMTNFFNAVRIVSPAQLPWTKTKLLPFGEFARTDVQADLLDKVLFGGVTFAGLEQEGAPHLMVCATDLYSGASIGMSRQGVLRRPMIKPGEKDTYVNFNDPEENCTFVECDNGYPLNASLSQVVAASGAFPGAFNAVRREIRLGAGPQRQPVLLADGGLSDNSALTVMAFADMRAGWNLDLLFSSDASALFNTHVRDEIKSFGEVTRAVDIIYANVGVRRTPGKECPVHKTKMLLTPVTYTDLVGEKSEQFGPEIEKAVARLDEPALELACDLLSETDARGEVETLRGAALAGDTAARRRLAELLRTELDEALSAFIVAPTLEDHFGGETTGRLYHLGQLMVILEWGHIREELEKKLHERAGAAASEVALRDAPAADAHRTQ